MPDLHKVWVIATTEYGSAIRTKSFIVGIILLPVIMGLSILAQVALAKRTDTRPRAFGVIDHTKDLYPVIREAAEAHNARLTNAEGGPTGPWFTPRNITPDSGDPDEQLLKLSEEVRRGTLFAFVTIPANATKLGATAPKPLMYYSDAPNDESVRAWLTGVVNDHLRIRRYAGAGLDPRLVEELNRPITVENLGLVKRAAGPSATVGAGTGPGKAIIAASKVDPIRAFVVPAVLMFLMFFVIMTSAPQLLNSVIEEKMSRISEVLLGSVTPFELMLGKILGNTGIALTLAAIYLGGAFGLAAYHGYADVISPGLMAAFALFLLLAVFLYGSIYTAIGAACSELKDAQSLMTPVILLTMLPMFVWPAVIQDPSSNLALGMSLFPASSPFLMLMRLALSPAPPWWQVVLSIVLTTATALACVWAAGKVFRTGLLMQGKAPSFRELARWVMAR